MFENLAASFPSIEDLKFRRCYGLNSIRSVSSLPRLKHVVLNRCHGMKIVDILAPNLLTFSFNPINTCDLEDLCEVNLPTSLALKELMLARVRIGASLQKLMSELSGVLEVLKLYLCVTLENISISVRHLKELLMVDCSNLSIAEINNSPNLMMNSSNTFRLHKVHIVFPGGSDVPWSKWKDCLMKLSIAEDLKLVIRNSENIIIHENNEGPGPQDMDFVDLRPRYILSHLLFPTATKTLSAVCFKVELTELLLDGDFDYGGAVFGGFVMDTSQAEINPPALKCFLKEHSSGG